MGIRHAELCSEAERSIPKRHPTATTRKFAMCIVNGGSRWCRLGSRYTARHSTIPILSSVKNLKGRALECLAWNSNAQFNHGVYAYFKEFQVFSKINNVSLLLKKCPVNWCMSSMY